MIGGNMIDWISDPFGEDFDDLKNKVKVWTDDPRPKRKLTDSPPKMIWVNLSEAFSCCVKATRIRSYLWVRPSFSDHHETWPVHEGVWSQGRTVPHYSGMRLSLQEYILVWSDDMQLECAASLIKVLHNGVSWGVRLASRYPDHRQTNFKYLRVIAVYWPKTREVLVEGVRSVS